MIYNVCSKCEILPRVTKTLTLNFRSLQKKRETRRAQGQGEMLGGGLAEKKPSFGEGVQRRVKLEPAVLHIVPEASPKTPGERKIILQPN